MKQGYEYKDGKVTIYDSKTEPTEREYQDNIEEILIKENEVEFLEKKLSDLKESDKELEEILEDKTISWEIIRYIGMIIITLLALPIASSLIFKYQIQNLINILGGLKGYISVFTQLVAFGLSPICIKKCNEINQYKKEKKSIENQIEYIESYLKELKEELVKLNNDKTKENEPIKQIKNKIDFNNIKVIKAILALIEEASFEEKKYLEYLKKGILREKLSKYYEENEIRVIEHYVGKKAKSLEKKYKD